MTIENNFLLSCKMVVRKRFPLLLTHAGRVYAKSFGFRDERAFLKGRLEGVPELKSLVLLSCNRAATQFTEDVLIRIYRKSGGRNVALNRYLFFTDKKVTEHIQDPDYMMNLMKPEGFFFGQQGPFSNTDFLDYYKVVTMVRDPRDLLISHFFSLTEAHVPRDRAFLAHIEQAKADGLQKYVLREDIVSYYESCLRQAARLKSREDVLSCRYEDMMADFTGFHEKCQNFLLGSCSDELSEELEGLYQKPDESKGENKARHRRSGAWGQFKSHLEPEVVASLNERFRPLLEFFEYEI